MKSAARKSNVTRLRPAKPRLKTVRNRIDAAEWQARVDLAAAFRLTALVGWTDMLGTHISCRVPGSNDQFLINPYGLLFEEITASSLIKCDINGAKLSESPYEVNFAGFTIHSAIHMGRHDAHAVMHVHNGYGVAVSAQKDGLLPITQKALTAPLNQLRYHDYEGVAHDLTERERLVRDLGDGNMLILRNHGTLTVGATVGEMFARMYKLEQACKFQILAMSGGTQLNYLPQEVVDHTVQQGMELTAKGGRSAGGTLMWEALLRKLDREDPGYAV
jgi:ribulose-5-phosphate 4-epimerase/fuculose-1-phosphate aldolase